MVQVSHLRLRPNTEPFVSLIVQRHVFCGRFRGCKFVLSSRAQFSELEGDRLQRRSCRRYIRRFGAVKQIAVKEDKITHLAIMPSPRTLTEETEMFARFVFGSGGGGSSREPRLNTWRSLPLLGGNMICLTRNSDEHYELVMYPQLRGYQLHFYSAWAEVTITLVDCDILKTCPTWQVWHGAHIATSYLCPVTATVPVESISSAFSGVD